MIDVVLVIIAILLFNFIFGIFTLPYKGICEFVKDMFDLSKIYLKLQRENQALKSSNDKLKSQIQEYEKEAEESALAFIKIGKTIDHLRVVNERLRHENCNLKGSSHSPFVIENMKLNSENKKLKEALKTAI